MADCNGFVNHQVKPRASSSLALGSKISDTVCLDMHHKDGNSKNNRLSNVLLLCPNCHSLTNNYKRVNKLHKSDRSR